MGRTVTEDHLATIVDQNTRIIELLQIIVSDQQAFQVDYNTVLNNGYPIPVQVPGRK
jgi:hypothetical protein